MKPLVIWGCGGHGREVNHLCQQLGYRVLGFLDERENLKGEIINNIEVLGDIHDLNHLTNEVEIVCCGVGNPLLKKRFVQKTIDAGFTIAATLIHPNVNISNFNSIGKGSLICEGAILTTNIIIGDFVIVNRGVNISHDNMIHDFVTISPGVNLAGNVTINEGAYLGIGSSIKEKVTIGSWSIIGGGAFIKNDVLQNSMYAGVPAKMKKNNIIPSISYP